MPATRKNLPDGITLIDVNGNKYTVVGDPIGFGGWKNCVLYTLELEIIKMQKNI